MTISTRPLFPAPAAVLRAWGPDALTFLQGQFTQDLRPVEEGQATYGLWLNQKGKVMGDSHAVRLGAEEWLLVSEFTAASQLQARLEDYLIADEVELRDETSSWQLQREAEPATAGEGTIAAVVKGEGGGWRWSSRATLAAGLGLVPAGETGATSDERAYRAARLQAGLPSVGHDFGEADLPQEAGLEAYAVSFHKGCYLGQEVMARLHAMGQVRRGWRVVRGSGAPPSEPADLVDSGGKRVGELRTAYPLVGGWIGAAMLQVSAVRPEAVWSCAGVVGPIELAR